LGQSHYDYAKELIWLGWQCLQLSREITETALAHVMGDQAEQTYRRGDALEKRRKLMDAWSAYCEPKTSANILQLRNFLRETVN